LSAVGQQAGGVQYRDERADELRARYHAHYGDRELPVPVEAIAVDLLGLCVDEAPLEVSGLLLPAERQIYVNEEEPPQRRRFTLAHELGHWVCQCLEGRTAPVYCRADDLEPGADRSLEREANVFAAELLMPEPLIRGEWSTSASAGDLAIRFGVSAEAIGWRLYNLGIVTSQP
jgi:uncharacterized protein DUF955